MDSIRAVRGMNDIPPEKEAVWNHLEEIVREVMVIFGYGNIRTPIVEKTDLFTRSLGEITDIVEKEMYTFKDQMNGESLTLRPEGTAACVRAVIQHNLVYGGGKRLWYMGPMFRHERPQKGRYRQFHQLGVEAVGFQGYEADTEHLLINNKLWQMLEISDLQLEINSLGNLETREEYKKALVKYLTNHLESIDENSRKRLATNPLRILDSKDANTREIVSEGPKIIDYLDKNSLKRFDSIKKTLDKMGVDYAVNNYLVRGLDYYNDLIYEWTTASLGAQGTVSAGGRYDALCSQIGGKETPACGFAVGMERVIELLMLKKIPPKINPIDVYMIFDGQIAREYAWNAASLLREEGVSVIFNYDSGSFKSQIKRADSSGADYAIIIGEDEAASELVSLKPLRSRTPQELLTLKNVIKKIKSEKLGVKEKSL